MVQFLFAGYLSGAEDHFKQTRSGYVDFWLNDAPAYGKNGTQYGTYQVRILYYKIKKEAKFL